MADKETKDVVIALNEVAVVVAKHMRDGAVKAIEETVADILASAELKAVLTEAITNIVAVPTETQKFTFQDWLDLGMCQISYIPKLLVALQKV
jgi:hypothetical protein